MQLEHRLTHLGLMMSVESLKYLMKLNQSKDRKKKERKKKDI